MLTMTDPVAISLITAIGSVVTLVLTIVNNQLVRKSYAVTKNTGAVMQSTNETVVKLENNTNGMQADLLKITSESEFAKGHLAGVETATNLIKTEPPK